MKSIRGVDPQAEDSLVNVLVHDDTTGLFYQKKEKRSLSEFFKTVSEFSAPGSSGKMSYGWMRQKLSCVALMYSAKVVKKQTNKQTQQLSRNISYCTGWGFGPKCRRLQQTKSLFDCLTKIQNKTYFQKTAKKKMIIGQEGKESSRWGTWGKDRKTTDEPAQTREKLKPFILFIDSFQTCQNNCIKHDGNTSMNLNVSENKSINKSIYPHTRAHPYSYM